MLSYEACSEPANCIRPRGLRSCRTGTWLTATGREVIRAMFPKPRLCRSVHRADPQVQKAFSSTKKGGEPPREGEHPPSPSGGHGGYVF